ncbi:hypothetical protein MKEN_00465700 [Mycena kentingensis (nom. inval.)]|nr:hypothetical protein MKEN_00465700 [Mycena kentingensis (nom. inval.)]
MALDPFHHSQDRRAASPTVGQRRPVPDPNVSSDSDDPPDGPDVTRSPTTQRIVRRRRTDDPVAPLHFDQPTAGPTPSPPPQPATSSAAARAAAAWSEDQLLLLPALQSALARALATTGAIQLDGEATPAYPAHIQELVRALHERILCTPAPAAPSYADVAAAPAATACADPRSHTTSAPAHPRAAPPTTRTDKQAPTVPTRRRRKRPIRRSEQRVILRWTGAKPDPAVRSEYEIRALVNDKLWRAAYIELSSVSWTRAGNLALHLAPPATASQLLLCSDLLVDAANKLWELDGDPVVEADTEWARVVLHDVPVELYFADGASSIWQQLGAQGLTVERIATVTPMLKGGEPGVRRHMSVKLAFTEQHLAEHLLSRRGIPVYGSFCRVSRYRA